MRTESDGLPVQNKTPQTIEEIVMAHKVGKQAVLLVICLLLVCLTADTSIACTSFCLRNDRQMVLGKNYDWKIGYGLVMVNKRNVLKRVDFASYQGSIEWISKYGSITFNQYGRELPQGGMNEEGLVIEILWLEETEYPAPDNRPEVGPTLWIQYQLDNSRSVEDVIRSFSGLRIESQVKVHFMVADRTGHSAAIEFIGGELIYHKSENMPSETLTNNTYDKSVAYLRKYKGFGGDLPVPESSGSIDRFVRASAMVKEYDAETSGSIVDYAFEILADVAIGSYTKWSIVYDQQMMRVYFRTLDNRKLKHLDLAALEFDCSTPVKIMDINTNTEGDILGSLIDYTTKVNRNLIGKSFKNTSFLNQIPDSIMDLIATYPDSTKCTEKP
jgi:choloylglycine hydrolase